MATPLTETIWDIGVKLIEELETNIAKLLSAILVSIPVLLPANAQPTQTGDIIGIMKMLPDKSIEMNLHSVTCEGIHAEALITVKPTDQHYQDDLGSGLID